MKKVYCSALPNFPNQFTLQVNFYFKKEKKKKEEEEEKRKKATHLIIFNLPLPSKNWDDVPSTNRQ